MLLVPDGSLSYSANREVVPCLKTGEDRAVTKNANQPLKTPPNAKKPMPPIPASAQRSPIHLKTCLQIHPHSIKIIVPKQRRERFLQKARDDFLVFCMHRKRLHPAMIVRKVVRGDQGGAHVLQRHDNAFAVEVLRVEKGKVVAMVLRGEGDKAREQIFRLIVQIFEFHEQLNS